MSGDPPEPPAIVGVIAVGMPILGVAATVAVNVTHSWWPAIAAISLSVLSVPFGIWIMARRHEVTFCSEFRATNSRALSETRASISRLLFRQRRADEDESTPA